MQTTITNTGSINHVERRKGVLWACTYSPLVPLPANAPQAVKDLAAKEWTPEVIQAAKDRAAAAKSKAG